MASTVLTLLLSAQLMCTPAICSPAAQTMQDCSSLPQESRLWWGLIDPELSAWLARLPLEEEADKPVVWDWSWRNFLAALFGQPQTKEAIPDAPCV